MECNTQNNYQVVSLLKRLTDLYPNDFKGEYQLEYYIAKEYHNQKDCKENHNQKSDKGCHIQYDCQGVPQSNEASPSMSNSVIGS